MTRATTETERVSQHVIDKIRAVTTNGAQRTSVSASVGHVSTQRQPGMSVSNSALHNQVSSVTTAPTQQKKSEWDDFLDDEPTNDVCQEQDGGELLFAVDDGLHAVNDEW